MMKIYLMELRRSPALICFPAMIVIDLLVLFGRSRYWIGVWPEASAAAQVTTLFLGPILSAVSAWQAGRTSRSSMPAFLVAGARPTWQPEAARLAATLTLGFAAYSIGCIVAAAASWPESGSGFLWPNYLLLGAATLTLYGAVGHIIGRIWPSPAFIPIVCALGGFILFLSIGQAYGLFVLSGTPNTTLRDGPVLARITLSLAFVALAIFSPIGIKSGKEIPLHKHGLKARLAFSVSPMLLFSASVGVATAGPLRIDRSVTAESVTCDQISTAAPKVCVWREHVKYLPELTRIAERLEQIPQDWIRTPAVFYEFGLRPTRLGDRGFDVVEGHVRSAAIAMASQVSYESLGMDKCLPPETAARGWQAVDRIDLWLEYRAMGLAPEKADEGLNMPGVSGAKREASRMVSKSESVQQAWTEQERTHVRKAGCVKIP